MKRESEVEQYLVDRVKALGGEVRKVKWLGRDGAPDRLVMLPELAAGGMNSDQLAEYDDYAHGRTIWVELKAEGLAAFFPHTPHERKQRREHERMRKMGQRVEVVDSFEGVDRMLA